MSLESPWPNAVLTWGSAPRDFRLQRYKLAIRSDGVSYETHRPKWSPSAPNANIFVAHLGPQLYSYISGD